MLNWITWNRTVFDIQTELTLNLLLWIRTVWLNWIAWNRNVLTIIQCTYANRLMCRVIATTLRCSGGCYSFPWITPLYPLSLPYNAEC